MPFLFPWARVTHSSPSTSCTFTEHRLFIPKPYVAKLQHGFSCLLYALLGHSGNLCALFGKQSDKLMRVICAGRRFKKHHQSPNTHSLMRLNASQRQTGYDSHKKHRHTDNDSFQHLPFLHNLASHNMPFCQHPHSQLSPSEGASTLHRVIKPVTMPLDFNVYQNLNALVGLRARHVHLVILGSLFIMWFSFRYAWWRKPVSYVHPGF